MGTCIASSPTTPCVIELGHSMCDRARTGGGGGGGGVGSKESCALGFFRWHA